MEKSLSTFEIECSRSPVWEPRGKLSFVCVNSRFSKTCSVKGFEEKREFPNHCASMRDTSACQSLRHRKCFPHVLELRALLGHLSVLLGQKQVNRGTNDSFFSDLLWDALELLFPEVSMSHVK